MSEGSEVCGGTGRGVGRGAGRGTGEASTAVRSGFGVVGAAWVLLGPLQYDDAWYELMARNVSAAGYVGNYVYMFNVTESPFVASQYLAAVWGGLGG